MKRLEDAIDSDNYGKIRVLDDESEDIHVKDLTLRLPSGEPISSPISLNVHVGERLMIVGNSGAGKSTFLRSLAGLWPFGEGDVHFPNGIKKLFVPQKNYIPAGSLKAALCYPSSVNDFSDDICIKALENCNLRELCVCLHEEARWASRLSPGEQQRLSFARVLLQEPDVVFFDEATSSLDQINEDHLYELIVNKLPRATIVSVAHRSSVRVYHQWLFDITAGELFSIQNSAGFDIRGKKNV